MSYGCPHCGKHIDDAMPKSRFDEVNEKKKAAEAQLAENTKALDKLKKEAAVGEKHALRIAELEKELRSTKTGHEVDLAMAGSGIVDSDVRDLFKARWESSVAEGEEPTPFGDWFAELQADREKAPAILRPFLPSQADDKSQQRQQSRGTPGAGTESGASQKAPPSAPAAIDPANWRRPDGSFDVDAFKAQREAATKQLRDR